MWLRGSRIRWALYAERRSPSKDGEETSFRNSQKPSDGKGAGVYSAITQLKQSMYSKMVDRPPSTCTFGFICFPIAENASLGLPVGCSAPLQLDRVSGGDLSPFIHDTNEHHNSVVFHCNRTINNKLCGKALGTM